MRLMRILVMFDLPVGTKWERKVATKFRKSLEDDGFTMIQFSIYSRIVNGADGIEKHRRRLRRDLPEHGNIRFLTITERQYASMDFLVGKPRAQEKTVSSQLQLEF